MTDPQTRPSFQSAPIVTSVQLPIITDIHPRYYIIHEHLTFLSIRKCMNHGAFRLQVRVLQRDLPRRVCCSRRDQPSGKTQCVQRTVSINASFVAQTSNMHSMWKNMTAVFKQLSSDPDVRCVVLSGAGEKAFSAGLDVRSAAQL